MKRYDSLGMTLLELKITFQYIPRVSLFVFLVVAIGILAVDTEALSTVIDVVLEIVVAGNAIKCDSNQHT